MTTQNYIQILFYLVLLTALTTSLVNFIATVLTGGKKIYTGIMFRVFC